MAKYTRLSGIHLWRTVWYIHMYIIQYIGVQNMVCVQFRSVSYDANSKEAKQ